MNVCLATCQAMEQSQASIQASSIRSVRPANLVELTKKLTSASSKGADVFGEIDEAWQELCSRYTDQELSIVLRFIDAMHQTNHTTIAEQHKAAGSKVEH